MEKMDGMPQDPENYKENESGSSDKTPVTFLNQPMLREHDHYKEQNENRLVMVGKIDNWISTHELFQGQPVSVTFFQAGASGVVSLLETPENKYVLKTMIRADGPKGEPEFLKAWESVGVLVPHVYESGMLEEHPYILMSYINAKSLENYSEEDLLERGIFKKMGETLRKIHTTEATGFGKMKEDGVGEYESFKTWLQEFYQTINQLEYAQKHNLLPEETFGSIEEAKKILMENIGEGSNSTYCHWDFAPGNILNTDPLSVFDPVPNFNHPYLDIARSIVQTIGAGCANPESSKQFIEGYFSDEQVNEKFLQAAVLFVSHTKTPHWHRINEDKILEDVRLYLTTHKHLLD